MAKARGIPPLGRTPNALPAPQAPAYLPMAKARGITQDLVKTSLNEVVRLGLLYILRDFKKDRENSLIYQIKKS
jgi:hypothetical protein